MSNAPNTQSASHRQPTEFKTRQAGSPPQYAEGGNAEYSSVKPELGSQTRYVDHTDRLVMLQLASFEGRAL